MKLAGVALLVAVSLVLPLTAVPLHATQVEYRSIEAMGAEAQRIVRGTVVEVRPYWNATHTRILTETTIEIAEDLKGSGTSTVLVVQFGGAVDGVRMTVAGALYWEPGEEVILFLEESLPGRHRVSGFSQGKFSIERDPVTGEEFVRQSGLGSAELLGAPVQELRARIPVAELIERAVGQREGEE
jgi:hypothetical protein